MSTDWHNDPSLYGIDHRTNALHAMEMAVAAYKRTRPDIDTAAIIDKAVAAHYSKREIAPDKIVWEYGAAQARRVARDVAEAVVLAVLEDAQQNCLECNGTGVREISSSGDRETGFEREWDACDCGVVVENDQ